MEKLKIDNKIYDIVSVKKSNNLLTVVFNGSFPTEISDGNFDVLTGGKKTCAKLAGFNTIYKTEIVDGKTKIIFSNDNSVYTEEPVKDDEFKEVELTEEQKEKIEKQNKISKNKKDISDLRNELSQDDSFFIECIEATLAGKDLPYDENEIKTRHKNRDKIRKQIKTLENELAKLEVK